MLLTHSGRAGLASALGLDVLEDPVVELVPLGDVECEDGQAELEPRQGQPLP